MLYAYGRQTPLTAVGDLVLPAGASTSGTLSVYPAARGPGARARRQPQSALGRGRARSAADDRQTVAQRVAAVRGAAHQRPARGASFTPDPGALDASVAPVETTLTVSGSYVTGSIQRRTGKLRLRVSPASVPLQGLVPGERCALRDRRRDDSRPLHAVRRGRREGQDRDRGRRARRARRGRVQRAPQRLDEQRPDHRRVGRRRRGAGHLGESRRGAYGRRSRCAPARPPSRWGPP